MPRSFSDSDGEIFCNSTRRCKIHVTCNAKGVKKNSPYANICVNVEEGLLQNIL